MSDLVFEMMRTAVFSPISRPPQFISLSSHLHSLSLSLHFFLSPRLPENKCNWPPPRASSNCNKPCCAHSSGRRNASVNEPCDRSACDRRNRHRAAAMTSGTITRRWLGLSAKSTRAAIIATPAPARTPAIAMAEFARRRNSPIPSHLPIQTVTIAKPTNHHPVISHHRPLHRCRFVRALNRVWRATVTAM
jgi:hypothetical protein